MPVRLIKPYSGQAAYTLLWGSEDTYDALRSTGIADDQVEIATDYAPQTRTVTSAAAITSRNATTYKMNSTSPQNLTLSASGYWMPGGIITVEAIGTGTVTVTPATGVTINGSTAAVTVAAQNTEGRLLKTGPDAWTTMDGFTGQAAAALGVLGITPVQNRVAIIGDSIAQRNARPSTGQTALNGGAQLYSVGSLVWAAVLGRQRFVFEPSDDYAVNGSTSTSVLARLPAVLATTTAKTIVIGVGTNDVLNAFGPNIDFPTHKANMLAMVAMIQAAGIKVVILPNRPRGDSAFPTALSAAGIKQLIAQRDFAMSLSAMPGVTVIDTWKYAADPASTTGGIKLGYTVDGLHNGPTGAYWEGLAIAEAFGIGSGPGLFPPLNLLPSSNTDQFDAAFNLGGSLILNPMLQGTAGAVGGGGTGSLADGWNGGAGSGTGIQRAYSKVNGKQQVVLSGTMTASASPFLINQVPSAANLNVGDVIEGYCDVEVDAGMAGINSLQFIISDNGTGATYAGMVLKPDDSSTSLMPGVAWSGVIKIPRVALGSTNLSMGVSVSVQNGVTVAGTVRIGAAKISKVL